ncbi:MAG: peptidylprolyl isomerase [Bacteroidota bacterium]|jgi:FKBP-type peptidyl-prolyl cis-trans isomerase 2
MSIAKTGDTVRVHYHGRLTSGETFDSSAERDPLEFELGTGQVIAGFDNGVTGMTIGEKKTIEIPFLEAYGPRNESMIIEMPKERFPSDMQIEIGMPLMMSDGQGQNLQVAVTDIQELTVTLDANHPLAGKDLIFDLELVEIVGGSRIILTE